MVYEENRNHNMEKETELLWNDETTARKTKRRQSSVQIQFGKKLAVSRSNRKRKGKVNIARKCPWLLEVALILVHRMYVWTEGPSILRKVN